jgi:predicted TIM-barrel enzyme
MIRTIYTFCLLFVSLLGFSQYATIRGFVYNKSNGEPVAFSNVYLKGTTTGASTDLNGFFSINKINPGSYTLLVTNLEFDTISEKITVKAGEILSKKFFSDKGGIILNAIDVTAASAEKIENAKCSCSNYRPSSD